MKRQIINLALIGTFVVFLWACHSEELPAPTPEPEIEPTYDPELPIHAFEGFFLYTAEINSFVPCGIDELPGEGKGLWLVPNPEFLERYDNPTGVTLGNIASTYGPYDQFAIYVRFDGIRLDEIEPVSEDRSHFIGDIQVIRTFEASRRWVGRRNPELDFQGC